MAWKTATYKCLAVGGWTVQSSPCPALKNSYGCWSPYTSVSCCPRGGWFSPDDWTALCEQEGLGPCRWGKGLTLAG